MSFLQRNLEKEEAKRREPAVPKLAEREQEQQPESWHDKAHVKYFIGFAAGVVTSLAFLPQVVKSFRGKTASELTYITLVACLIGQGLWLAYGSSMKDRILILFSVVAFIMYALLFLSKLIFRGAPKTKSIPLDFFP